MKFKPSKADSDLWMKDCVSHYEYPAVYVNNSIVVSKDPLSITKKLKQLRRDTLKGVGEP